MVLIELNVVFVVYYDAMVMVLLFMKNHAEKIRNVNIISENLNLNRNP